jgi:hypothetical protein
MKNKLIILFSSILIILASSCTILHLRIDRSVSFNKYSVDTNSRIKLNIGIYLSEDFIQKMPLYNKDNELWTWYFTEGLKPIFEKVYIIKDLQELKNNPDINLIIKPELWSWLFFPRHCVLGFKFCFIDKYGIEQFAIKLEERNTFQKSNTNNLAQAMNKLMERLQENIVERKNEIINVNK